MVKQTLLGTTMEPDKGEALCAICTFPLENHKIGRTPLPVLIFSQNHGAMEKGEV